MNNAAPPPRQLITFFLSDNLRLQSVLSNSPPVSMWTIRENGQLENNYYNTSNNVISTPLEPQ